MHSLRSFFPSGSILTKFDYDYRDKKIYVIN